MKHPFKHLLTATGIALLPVTAHAAADEVHNVAQVITGTLSSASANVLIGPAADITVNGDWYITAGTLYIHPLARITGSGTIHLMNPSTYGSPAAATNLDAGSVSIGCKLSIENGNMVTLTAIDPATAYPASGFTETAPQLLATNLSMANDLNFNNTGAHLVLGDNNLVFSSGSPTITRTDLNTGGFTPDPTPGTPAQAYIVTNGTGVVTKQGLAAGAAFTYPVGQSAAGDYTPATVTNGSTVQSVNVAVKNYSGSAATETTPALGNGRSWLLYTSAGGPVTTLSLTHNTATNGTSYQPAQAAIVRQQSTAGVWSSPAAMAYGGPLAATGETGNPATLTSVSNAYYNNAQVLGTTATSTANNAWYSKSSEVLGGIQLTASAFLQGGMNTGNTAMRNDLQIAGILPQQSTTANSQAPLSTYASINSTGGAAGTVTDWVEVQLRNAATPGTIAERRSFLVRTNGTIVNPDGTSTLRFSSPPGNYYVVVDHRNHMPAMTGTALAMTEASPVTADFRSPATAVYNLNGANTAQAVAGSFRALWGGDVNPDGFVYYSDPANDRDALFSILGFDQSGFLSTYNRGDVNLDGFTYYSDPGNDRDALFKILSFNQSGFLEAQVP